MNKIDVCDRQFDVRSATNAKMNLFFCRTEKKKIERKMIKTESEINQMNGKQNETDFEYQIEMKRTRRRKKKIQSWN